MIPDFRWSLEDPRRSIEKEDPLGSSENLESAQSAIADPGTVCVYRRRAGTTIRGIRLHGASLCNWSCQLMGRQEPFAWLP